ncbi:MAG: hypothetical protein JWO19_5139 [Bryobacterales bacterium]|nr:hypothetical protein [Bryobacterales bacterium]
MHNSKPPRSILILTCLLFLTVGLQGANKVIAKEFYAEPPTLISLGFEWQIDGDDNHNATVSVFYRKKGTQPWKEGLPLLRLDHERINERAHQYVTPNMFSGSIFDLEPGVDYECRLVLADPDGVGGKAENIVTVRTRVEPKPAIGGKVYHAYPLDYKGKKEEPGFTGLLGAYYTGTTHSDNFNIFPARVQPGDTILVHAGLYKDDRFSYGGAGLGTVSSGTYFLTQSGTAEKPIVIKGAGDGEAIFDGDGAYNLFNILAANYNYFEGLTFRNTDLVFEAGLKNIIGSSGLTVKKCRFENIGRGIYTDWSGSKNYYIADNVFVGRFKADVLDPSVKLVSEYAVKVYGQGHVVAYNNISRFHDGVDVATYGTPDGGPNPIRDRLPVSIDFYNNDISNVLDNCIEADGGARNIRIFRNRCFNHGSRALSVQPSYGGPVYFIRNIVYNAAQGAVKFTASAAGIVVYHNTLIAAVTPMLLAVSNLHFRNNLIIGKDNTRELFSIETKTNYSSSDYNGFRPNPSAQFSFAWSSPPFSIRADAPVAPGGAQLSTQEQVAFEAPSRETRRFKTLKEFSAATGQDKHSVLVDYDIFQKVSPTGPDSKTLYKPEDFDFQLRPGSAGVDAGVRLTGVNDDFTGVAPDLGAYEIGQPIPHYGPRP